jgi:hypothetical protein
MGWGIKRNTTDALFSDYIRMRDGWRCQNCFTKYEPPTAGLQCSHFFGRGWKSVRWDLDNAFALCAACHTRLGGDPVGHTNFVLKKLGRRLFDSLTIRAHNPKRMDEKLTRIWLRMLIKGMKDREKELIIGAR